MIYVEIENYRTFTCVGNIDNDILFFPIVPSPAVYEVFPNCPYIYIFRHPSRDKANNKLTHVYQNSQFRRCL